MVENIVLWLFYDHVSVLRSGLTHRHSSIQETTAIMVGKKIDVHTHVVPPFWSEAVDAAGKIPSPPVGSIALCTLLEVYTDDWGHRNGTNRHT